MNGKFFKGNAQRRHYSSDDNRYVADKGLRAEVKLFFDDAEGLRYAVYFGINEQIEKARAEDVLELAFCFGCDDPAVI